MAVRNSSFCTGKKYVQREPKTLVCVKPFSGQCSHISVNSFVIDL